MKRLNIAERNRNGKSLALAAGAIFLLCSYGRAATIVTLEQAGSDVVATASGSIDLTGLTFQYSSSGGANDVVASQATIAFKNGGTIDVYSGITGPSSFGSGSITFASSQTGDVFGVIGYMNNIQLPGGYVSGAVLSSTLTWDNTTLAALGVTPGTYTWTWGSGDHADSVTLYAGVTPPTEAPEPGSVLLLSAGFAGFAGLTLRKHRRA